MHFRVASPPVTDPCFFGMDFPSREELFYNDHKGDIQSMSKWLGVDRHSCLPFIFFFFCLFGSISNDRKGDVQSMTTCARS